MPLLFQSGHYQKQQMQYEAIGEVVLHMSANVSKRCAHCSRGENKSRKMAYASAWAGSFLVPEDRYKLEQHPYR